MGSESSNDRFSGARAMLDWGFANYSLAELSVDPALITDVNIIGGEQDKISPQIAEKKFAVIEKGKEDKITLVTDLAIDVEAPIEKIKCSERSALCLRIKR